jgi:hypothetical protein
MSALKSALLHHQSCAKLVKFKDSPGLQELTQELSLLTEYLPKLVGMDRSIFVDIEKPLDVQMSPLCERICDSTLSFERRSSKGGAPPPGDNRFFASPMSSSTVASTKEADAESLCEDLSDDPECLHLRV